MHDVRAEILWVSVKIDSSCDVCEVCDGDLCNVNPSLVSRTRPIQEDGERINSTTDCTTGNYQGRKKKMLRPVPQEEQPMLFGADELSIKINYDTSIHE